MQVFVTTNLAQFDSIIVEINIPHAVYGNLITLTHPSRVGPLIGQGGWLADEFVESIEVLSPFWQAQMEPHEIRPRTDSHMLLLQGAYRGISVTPHPQFDKSMIVVDGTWPLHERVVDLNLVVQNSGAGRVIDMRPVDSSTVRFAASPFDDFLKRQNGQQAEAQMEIEEQNEEKKQEDAAAVYPPLDARPLQHVLQPQIDADGELPALPSLLLSLSPENPVMFASPDVPVSPSSYMNIGATAGLGMMDNVEMEPLALDEVLDEMKMQEAPAAEAPQAEAPPETKAAEAEAPEAKAEAPDELTLLCAHLAQHSDISADQWRNCFIQQPLGEALLQPLRGTEWGLQSCSMKSNKCWYFAMQVIHGIEQHEIMTAIDSAAETQQHNKEVKKAIFMALRGNIPKAEEFAKPLTKSTLDQFKKHIRKAGEAATINAKTGEIIKLTTFAGSNEAAVLAYCTEKESFRDTQVCLGIGV
jgi:hypothetical protein